MPYQIKEALYSQNASKMAAVQGKLKYKSADAKANEEWIAMRQKFVVSGNDDLAKLDEMRSQDDALITSIYDPVYRCVKVSEDSLN